MLAETVLRGSRFNPEQRLMNSASSARDGLPEYWQSPKTRKQSGLIISVDQVYSSFSASPEMSMMLTR
jgi:hypothetical protein